MFVYVGRRYTARVTGRAWKTVSCAFCKLDWAYEMTRTAEGTGRSPYYLDNEGARERASREAQGTLDRRLRTGVDVVWCPKCLRLQEHMFGKARMNEFGYWYLIAGITAAAAFLFCGVWGDRPWIENSGSPPGVFIVAAAALVLVSTLVRARRFDPNATAELRKRDGKRPRNKLMLRGEYEAGVRAARERGVEASRLLRLAWRRPAGT